MSAPPSRAQKRWRATLAACATVVAFVAVQATHDATGSWRQARARAEAADLLGVERDRKRACRVLGIDYETRGRTRAPFAEDCTPWLRTRAWRALNNPETARRGSRAARDFRRRYRLHLTEFNVLANLLRPFMPDNADAVGRPPVPVEVRLLILLHVLGRGLFFDDNSAAGSARAS